MDNRFENDFYSAEPQKPITEKPEPQPQDAPVSNEPQTIPVQAAPNAVPPREIPDVQGFNPQKPLMQNIENRQQPDEQGFDPVEHRAVYSENRFMGVAQNQQPPQPFQPQPFRPQPQTVQPQQAPYQGYYRPAQPPYNGQAAPRYPEQNPQNAAQSSADVIPGVQQPKKNKVNTALVIVVIVLGVLLVFSVCGLFAYTIFNPPRTSVTTHNKSNEQYDIPEFTLPDYGEYGSPKTPSETTPAEEHKESDFSNQVNKNYSGLSLAEKPADAKTNTSYNAEYAFNAASDSVVSVLCYSGKTDSQASSQGSGIVISSDGYVVTNAHVIGNSKTAYAIKVVAADGKEYTAGVVGYDARTDIAVLKLKDAKNLKAATFGNSDKLQLGEDIIIIGTPGSMEYQNSMTKGIVSALDREASSKSLSKFIQTDAAINPGNSGGPAVNIYGQVVGIASAKIADEMYEGMGFCIPSVQAKQIVDTLIKNGYVAGRVKIGISGVAISKEEAMLYNTQSGISVSGIEKGGPCDNTDLQEDDIITEFDGKEVSSFADIYGLLESHKEGDKVKLKFYRESTGKDYEIEITLKADK